MSTNDTALQATQVCLTGTRRSWHARHSFRDQNNGINLERETERTLSFKTKAKQCIIDVSVQSCTGFLFALLAVLQHLHLFPLIFSHSDKKLI